MRFLVERLKSVQIYILLSRENINGIYIYTIRLLSKFLYSIKMSHRARFLHPEATIVTRPELHAKSVRRAALLGRSRGEVT